MFWADGQIFVSGLWVKQMTKIRKIGLDYQKKGFVLGNV